MPYTYTLTATIPASPQDIYDAWLDSRAHSAMTGGKATQSDEVGAAFTAWDDYIAGNNVELIPGERIVQTWRTTEFTDEHGDSIITVTLEPARGGTNLILEHANVPDGQTSYEESGWQEHYFEPMQRYFLIVTKGDAPAKPKPAKKKAVKKAAVKKKKTQAKSAAKKAAKKTAKKASARKPTKKKRSSKQRR
ncbi:MAG: SRPBCC domain-containing protein [Xanthobacteraceae bacterium]